MTSFESVSNSTFKTHEVFVKLLASKSLAHADFPLGRSCPLGNPMYLLAIMLACCITEIFMSTPIQQRNK